MAILALLSFIFLISTPGLLWVFRRFKINLQKLEFWVLVTSGTAWILVLILFILKPELHVNPIWDAGFNLLPSLAFSIDLVSTAFALAVAALVFFGMLVERTSAETSSWITPLAGVLLLVLIADSAYTVALGWTVLEALFLYRFLKNQGELQSSTRYILAVLARLAAPLLVVYLSLYFATRGTAPMLSELPPDAAPLLLAAGVIAYFGWFQTIHVFPDSSDKIRLIQAVNWLPASFGMLLIARAVGLAGTAPIFSWGSNLVAGLILIPLIFLIIFLPTERIMRLSCLSLMAGGYMIQSPAAVINIGILFLLPGMVILWEPEYEHSSLFKLVVAGICLMPLPFFPAWVSLIQTDGLISYLISAVYGLLASRLLIRIFLKWRETKAPLTVVSPLQMVGLGVILVSQYLISIQLGLFSNGFRFEGYPFPAWIAPIFVLLGSVIWIWLDRREIQERPVEVERILSARMPESTILTAISGEIVRLMTRLFEGDGGLIWTLLLAFLIVSLARLGGG